MQGRGQGRQVHMAYAARFLARACPSCIDASMAAKNDLLTLLIDRFADALAQRLDVTRRAGEARSQASAAGIRGKRKKGAKRSPTLIARTTAALLAHIKSNKGQRIEQIAAAMKAPTNDLKLPAQKLLADKKVKTKGQKRGTQYFPA